MPASGLQPLRVGPEDIEASEAGELAREVGVGNQAKGLIKAVARQVPKGLRVAASRFEHTERTRYLDQDEVLAQVHEIVGEDVVSKVLSARVRGDKSNPLDSNVVMLYETPSGRTARCYASYRKYFKKSQKAFDRALAAGAVKPSGEDDPKSIRRQNEQLQAEVDRLTKEGGSGEASEKQVEERAEELFESAINDAGFDNREDFVAALAGLKGDGAQADAGEEAEEQTSGEEGDAEEVEVPKGKATDLIAHMSDYSDAEVAALSKDERKTVAEAATAELKSRE